MRRRLQAGFMEGAIAGGVVATVVILVALRTLGLHL